MRLSTYHAKVVLPSILSASRLFFLTYHLHGVPVVRNVLAAVQTDNVGSELTSDALTITHRLERPWKAVISVDTTEEGVLYLGEHSKTPTEQYSRTLGAEFGMLSDGEELSNLTGCVTHS